MKSIIFAGDSFTWGEGLQYYSGEPDVFFPQSHTFNPNKISPKQMQFIINNRFPTIVGNYFKKEALVRADNGGSNTWSLHFLENINS